MSALSLLRATVLRFIEGLGPRARWSDLPMALIAWLLAFAWVRRYGVWTPLAVVQIAIAARLLTGDEATRRLLLWNGRAAAIGAGGGLLMVAGTYALYGPMTRAVPALHAVIAGLYDLLHADGYERASLVGIVALAVLAEEIVWRGSLLDPTDGDRLGWRASLTRLGAYAVVYGAAHGTSGSLLLVLVALSCGAAWALIRIVGRSLWAPVIAHLLWDAAVLFVWPLSG